MENDFKILVVEDDSSLGFIVCDNLQQNGYSADLACDGAEATSLFFSRPYDIIVLDIMLPKKDGFAVAREIRAANADVPILFLTARSMTEDKIKGLALGGDDYITKPFSMEELLLKIKIFLKRSRVNPAFTASGQPAKISIGQYVFFPDELILSIGGEQKKLTLKEAELIRLFYENTNKTLSRSDILTKIWGTDDYFLGRSLDVFISRLRKYFSADPNLKITNIHGLGFRFSIHKEN